MEGLIKPHGGVLVNRALEGKEREDAEKRAVGLKKITLNDREISDLEMISIGALSPLEGFMCKDDYHSVMDTMHLKNGLPWTMPITLSVTKDEATALKVGMEVALVNGEQGRPGSHEDRRDIPPSTRRRRPSRYTAPPRTSTPASRRYTRWARCSLAARSPS